MYTIEYTSHVSGGFGYHMDVFDETLEVDSIFGVLDFIKSHFEMDCDYVIVDYVFCNKRKLDMDMLFRCANKFDYEAWDRVHYPEYYL